MHASIQMMATPISIANIARVAAGAVAMLWALFGLADVIAGVAARGFDALLAVELGLDLVLAAGAIMALAKKSHWARVIIAAAAAVTIVRVLSVRGTNEPLFAVTSVVMFGAIVGIAFVAMRT